MKCQNVKNKGSFIIYFCKCSDVGIYDRVVIQELLKTMAQSHQLESSCQKDFKGTLTEILLLSLAGLFHVI